MTTKVMDGKRETLTQYLAGMLESGSDGVGGDWEAGEAARAVEYEAEQWLKQLPPTTQPLPDTGRSGTVEQLDGSVATFWPPRKADTPDTGGEWRVVKTIMERETSDVELHGPDEPLRLPWHRRELLEQIVADHNAVEKLVDTLKLFLAMDNCNYDLEAMRRSGLFEQVIEVLELAGATSDSDATVRAAVSNATKERR